MHASMKKRLLLSLSLSPSLSFSLDIYIYITKISGNMILSQPHTHTHTHTHTEAKDCRPLQNAKDGYCQGACESLWLFVYVIYAPRPSCAERHKRCCAICSHRNKMNPRFFFCGSGATATMCVGGDNIDLMKLYSCEEFDHVVFFWLST
jgi:hypothetical protein